MARTTAGDYPAGGVLGGGVGVRSSRFADHDQRVRAKASHLAGKPLLQPVQPGQTRAPEEPTVEVRSQQRHGRGPPNANFARKRPLRLHKPTVREGVEIELGRRSRRDGLAASQGSARRFAGCFASCLRIMGSPLRSSGTMHAPESGLTGIFPRTFLSQHGTRSARADRGIESNRDDRP